MGPVSSLSFSQSFTIHGLWPSTTASQTYGDFDVSIIDENEELKDNMNNYWPPQSRATGPETFLWEHEWTKHGPDYAEIILNLQPDRFTGESEEEKNRQLQAAFFNDVVAFYQRFAGAQKYPKNIFSKEEFGRVFGIEADQFTLSCVRANIVREIKVCFNLTPSGAVITRCTSTANTGCKKGNAFELPAWEVSNQDRVIAEPSTLNEEN
jgi:ribonuclease I